MLKPLGFHSGARRTWIYHAGFCTISVWFEPSSWGKGSYSSLMLQNLMDWREGGFNMEATTTGDEMEVASAEFALQLLEDDVRFRSFAKFLIMKNKMSLIGPSTPELKGWPKTVL
jgi:hypothetical protein